MILNAVIHGVYRYAENWPEKSRLIKEVMASLQPERRDTPWVDAGEIAYFMFADRRHSPSVRDWFPDNVLQVSVNRETEYGGLVWSANQGRLGKDYVSEHIWVTDNPNPPSFDPRVVADPGVPYFFDPKSAIPLGQILAALEEFCMLENGDRPECVQWVHGDLNGERCV